MSAYLVQVERDVPVSDEIVERIRRAALSTLRHETVDGPAELTLLLTDSGRVRQLNNDFLGIDRATDVLSFPLGDPLPGGGRHLGDVAIAVPVARAQADAAGHTLEAELALLTIHGVLHLLGYEHAADGDRERMWYLQERLLAELGLEATPTEE